MAEREQRIAQLEEEKERAKAEAKTAAQSQISKLQQRLDEKEHEMESLTSRLKSTEADLQEKNRLLASKESEVGSSF